MRIMIIGASHDRRKFGNKALRAYVASGHDVVPVNPNEHEVEGIACYATADQPEGPFDRALLYVPPSIGEQVLDPLAERGDVDEIWLNPGADGSNVVHRARELGLSIVRGCAILDIGASPYAP